MDLLCDVSPGVGPSHRFECLGTKNTLINEHDFVCIRIGSGYRKFQLLVDFSILESQRIFCQSAEAWPVLYTLVGNAT